MKMVYACFIIFILLAKSCNGYKHVIFMHGLLAGEKEVEHFKAFVDQYHPGTSISVIDDFQNLQSLQPLWKQVEKIRSKMQQIMSQNPEGVHLVCFSQGGLICRGVVETLPTHNVINFISLSSPQAGQYGDTSYLDPLLPKVVVKDVYKFAYTMSGQHISVGNYWNDPHHQDLHFHWSAYLAVINNQSTTSRVFNKDFRDNFLRVSNLVLVGGPDDGVITPWQSSQFGSYGPNEEIVEFRQQQFYTADWFGLQSLDARRSVHIHTIPGVIHRNWHRNVSVFKQCIEPWLT